MTLNLPEAAQSYVEHGLSVIPVKKDKRPAIAWKSYQQEIMNETMLQETFSDTTLGGIGIVCGKVSGNLEVIDVDVKYDVTGKLAQSLLDLIAGVITDVELPIVRTVNMGLHLYYRCNEIAGNQKLASNVKKEVLIETRGEGGYVVAPPTPGYTLFHGSILAIPEISLEQREKLFAIAASFDETETEGEREPSFSIDASTGRSPFEDYNQRGDVVALLEKHGWAVVADKPDQIHLKRPGKAEDQTSASYHKEKRLFYVFTTSTVFEAGRAYNPAQVFSTLECAGDYPEAARLLAADGFGDSGLSTTSNSSECTSSTSTPLLPIEGFPPLIQDFITTCADVYGTPRDYWAAGVLVSTALGIGDKLELMDKYSDVSIIWLCNVGDVSIGKTEPLKVCLRYFEKKDSEAIQDYNLALAVYEKAQGEAFSIGPENRPQCRQYILKDYTPEALAKVHASNNRGLLIYRDELKGWIDDFGRYSKSGEQSTMLSLFNRDAITINRKGEGQIINIPEPLVLITGGMQPDLLPDFAKGNRMESGFMARFVFTYPEHQVRPGYLEGTLPQEMMQTFENYLDTLTNLPHKHQLSFASDAKREYIAWYNRNDEIINSTTDSHLRGSYGKLPIVCSRLIVVFYGMWLMVSEEEADNRVKLHHVKTAIGITEYFRSTAEKVYRRIFGNHLEQLPDKKLVAKYLVKEGGLPKTRVAEILNVDRKQIQRWTA